jgi:hypothetical protein
MHDTTVNGLRASIRALEDVIEPRSMPRIRCAVEQSRMVRGYLALIADRLPFRHDRLRHQAKGLLELGGRLLPHAAICGDELEGALRRQSTAPRRRLRAPTRPSASSRNPAPLWLPRSARWFASAR